MENPAQPVTLPRPKDAFPLVCLQTALQASGDYVYAYYGRKEHLEFPFYVGKGRGTRALVHWNNAASDKDVSVLKDQEIEIRQILSAATYRRSNCWPTTSRRPSSLRLTRP
jgi:hypothetical protein